MRNFPPLQNFWHNQDFDQFMALVFEKFGMHGNKPDERYKQMTSWCAIRKMIKERTCDNRQL